jgi:hypothetical protein
LFFVFVKLIFIRLIHWFRPPEQVVHGDAQLLHCRSDASAHWPEGQDTIHVDELKKFGLVQLVQVVAESKHVVQGVVQLLQVLSLVSPHDPALQGLMQVFEFRKYGLAQLVQVVAAPEQVKQSSLQSLHNLSEVSLYWLLAQLNSQVLVVVIPQKLLKVRIIVDFINFFKK